MGEAILIDNVGDAAVAVPVADTAILTNNIKGTVYDHIRVDADVAIVTAALSTSQAINIKLKLGASTLFTWVVTPVGEIRTIHQKLVYISDHALVGGLEVGGVLTITIGAAAADAATTIQALNMYVTSVDD